MHLNVRLHIFFGFSIAIGSAWQRKPDRGGEKVVKPEIAIPGVWKVNKDETLLFLPLDIPSDLPLERVKVMTNGESILVLVTDQAKDKPETKAVRKYKLILESLKDQAGYDEGLLKTHLEEWYQTEQDDEVRVLVKSALDSLNKVRDAKTHKSGPPPTMSIPLGMLHKQALVKNVSLVETKPGTVPDFLAATPSRDAVKHSMLHMVAETDTGKRALDAHRSSDQRLRTKIIKESFVVKIPFPVSAEEVFVLQTRDDDLMVSMPLKKRSLEAQGISTGGKAFIPSPVYNLDGQLIGGKDEAPSLYTMAPTFSAEYFEKKDALQPLNETKSY